MKRRLFVNILFTLILLLMCVAAFMGCEEDGDKPVPQVEIVSLAAADGVSTGETDALHLLAFTAPDGSKTSVSVQKNNMHATVADYYSTAADERTQQIIFHAEGEYTVTVYAYKDGMQGSATKTLTVVKHDVSVSDVTLRLGAGETAGTVDALYKLGYTVTDGSSVTVSVNRNNQQAETADYTYDAGLRTVVFHTPGTYTVTVTATVGTVTDSGSTQIVIDSHDSPQVTLLPSVKKVEEDEAVLLSRTVSYHSGDRRKSETYKVSFRANSSAVYSTADEDTYTICGDTFTPRIAGRWRVTLVALGECGSHGEGHTDIECTAKSMQIEKRADAPARYRIQTGTATLINAYTLSGAYDKYNVSFDTHGKAGLKATNADDGCISVTATAVDCFTLTVTYTHKTMRTLKHSLDIELYSVESLFYAPEFGEDPFDGMPDEVLTSVGYLVYTSATFRGEGRKITGNDIECTVTHDTMHTDTSGKSAGAEILYAANENNYPYIMPRNFDDNTATGGFTVRMVVTDPLTGYAAVAEKTFTVVPTGNNVTEAAQALQAHVEKYSDFFKMGIMNFSNASSDCRQNMVLTKTGTIMQRSNPSWALKDDNSDPKKRAENSDFARMDLDPALGSCRLEFKFTLIGANPGNGNVCLGIGVRPISNGGWGWSGFMHVQSITETVDGKAVSKLNLQNDMDTKGTAIAADADLVRPDAVCGSTMYVRIDRVVSGSKITYTLYAAFSEGGEYKSFGGSTYNSNTNSSNPGAPQIAQYQFTHRNAGGCYAVEDVSVTAL